jgi:hypothetical protein
VIPRQRELRENPAQFAAGVIEGKVIEGLDDIIQGTLPMVIAATLRLEAVRTASVRSSEPKPRQLAVVLPG